MDRYIRDKYSQKLRYTIVIICPNAVTKVEVIAEVRQWLPHATTTRVVLWIGSANLRRCTPASASCRVSFASCRVSLLRARRLAFLSLTKSEQLKPQPEPKIAGASRRVWVGYITKPGE